MGVPVAVLFVPLVVYRFAETAYPPPGARPVGWTRDWSLWAIIVPQLVTLAGALAEHLLRRTHPETLWVVVGGVLMAVGIGIRARARRDLGDSFSVVVRTPAEGAVVRRGLYATIRHPLYLGHMVVLVGLPTLLGCRWTWIPALVGVAATLLRVVVEERYLGENLPGYQEYMQLTRRLIPFVW